MEDLSERMSKPHGRANGRRRRRFFLREENIDYDEPGNGLVHLRLGAVASQAISHRRCSVREDKARGGRRPAAAGA